MARKTKAPLVNGPSTVFKRKSGKGKGNLPPKTKLSVKANSETDSSDLFPMKYDEEKNELYWEIWVPFTTIRITHQPDWLKKKKD
jgi:hypothetical protein